MLTEKLPSVISFNKHYGETLISGLQNTLKFIKITQGLSLESEPLLKGKSAKVELVYNTIKDTELQIEGAWAIVEQMFNNLTTATEELDKLRKHPKIIKYMHKLQEIEFTEEETSSESDPFDDFA